MYHLNMSVFRKTVRATPATPKDTRREESFSDNYDSNTPRNRQYVTARPIDDTLEAKIQAEVRKFEASLRAIVNDATAPYDAN